MHEFQRLHSEAFGSKPFNALNSPPDIFAICASFAKTSACYLLFSTKSTKARRKTISTAQKEGREWRRVIDSHQSPPRNIYPSGVQLAWHAVSQKIGLPLEALTKDEDFKRFCLYLIVASDEACAGIGVPQDKAGCSYFELIAESRIYDKATLCCFIPESSLRVLPKQHVPSSGFNVRSLTHHLALLSPSEVRPEWMLMRTRRPKRTSFNLLLAPWPLQMAASQIRPSKRKSRTAGFGYFEYEPDEISGSVEHVRTWLIDLFDYADSIGQKIDLVVFPESSLSEGQWRAVSTIAQTRGAYLVAGVRVSARDNELPNNTLRMLTPHESLPELLQYKHHRWRLEKSQIVNYGLGGTLDLDLDWWEDIAIKPRTLQFLAISPDLVLCPLICEDLARQDPVAELVRSVGPNLVIALLMDGPQIAERWSARYASVLADDPGSSVLTISSLGMVGLSKPIGHAPSRAFGSWKDCYGSHTPLSVGPDEVALVLNLQFRITEECTVDGRTDGGVSSTPVLCGVHAVPRKSEVVQ